VSNPSKTAVLAPNSVPPGPYVKFAALSATADGLPEMPAVRGLRTVLNWLRTTQNVTQLARHFLYDR
jgi:hypothetical protein